MWLTRRVFFCVFHCRRTFVHVMIFWRTFELRAWLTPCDTCCPRPLTRPPSVSVLCLPNLILLTRFLLCLMLSPRPCLSRVVAVTSQTLTVSLLTCASCCSVLPVFCCTCFHFLNDCIGCFDWSKFCAFRKK